VPEMSCILLRNEVQHMSTRCAEKDVECQRLEDKVGKLEESIGALVLGLEASTRETEAKLGQAAERGAQLESELMSQRELAAACVFRNEELVQELHDCRRTTSSMEAHFPERRNETLLAETRLCSQLCKAQNLACELEAEIVCAGCDVKSLAAHIEALQSQHEKGIRSHMTVGSTADPKQRLSNEWPSFAETRCRLCAMQRERLDAADRSTEQLRESIANHLAECGAEKEALRAASEVLQEERDMYYDQRNSCVLEIEELRSQLSMIEKKSALFHKSFHGAKQN
jgi:hypothetical protein